MCERCGKLATLTIVNRWEATLCKEHFEEELKDIRFPEDGYYPEVYPDL
jgi:hypothetical protein